MKPTELRIGNYVADDVGSVGFLRQFTPKSYVLKKEFSTQTWSTRSSKTGIPIFAIPLTEEWLLKFGFEQVYSSAYRKKYDSPIAWIGYDYGQEEGMTGLRIYGHYIKIDHVHQLQNLYHALTGQELEIKTENK